MSLTVASGGPKLQKSAIAEKDCTFDTGPDACHNFVGGLGHPLNAKAIDMDDLVHYIGNWTDLPVVNRTALSGLFTVNTEGWVPMRLPPPPPNSTPAVNSFAGLPTIFTVLGKLGLELKRQQDVLPVYTVERIERQPPTDDHALLRARLKQPRSFSATFPSGRVLFPTQWTGSGLRLEISAFPRSQSTEGHSGSDHELPVMSALR
jgi:hypothetical protein